MSILQNSLIFKVQALNQKKNWELSDQVLTKWANRLHKQKVDHFQIDEILHYATKEQVEKNMVDNEILNSDKLFMRKLCLQNPVTITKVYQDPSVTFGQESEAFLCLKCKKMTGSPMPEQRRTSDEPMRVVYFCRFCEHIWFTN